MTEKRMLDSEFEWIVRMCTNAFNIYLTTMHFIFYDNTLSLQPENSEISLLSYALFMAALDFFAYRIYQ